MSDGMKIDYSGRELVEVLLKRHQIGIIREEDSLYGECLNELKAALTQRSILPLLGAGVSKPWPSCLPLAIPLTKPIRDAIWEASREVRNELTTQGHTKSVRDAKHLLYEETRMEMLFDALFQAFGDVAFDGLNVLDGTTPNSNHEALASLAVAGYLPKCITLNFDVLIETAILIKKGTYSTYCPLADKMLGEEVISSSDILIVKPHGSFAKPGQYSDRLQYVAATLSQCGRLPMIANINAIGGLIRKSNVLLVAGYSDNDWDIFPVLRDHSGTLERVIWIAHADVKKLHQPQNPEQIVNILGDRQKVKVLEFIAAFGQRASILIGDLRDVLSKLQRGHRGRVLIY